MWQPLLQLFRRTIPLTTVKLWNMDTKNFRFNTPKLEYNWDGYMTALLSNCYVKFGPEKGTWNKEITEEKSLT